MKYFDFIVVPSGADGVRKWRLPKFILIAFASLAVTISIATIGVGIWATLVSVDQSKLSELEDENSYLSERLATIDIDLKRLRGELARLGESEQRVREVFGFPEIDPAERELGIGGFPIAQDNASDIVQSVHSQEAGIDRLLRRCNFERENFEEIYGRLLSFKDRLDHTPSVMPTHGRISRGFGMKPNPFTGAVQPHNGLDIAGQIGTPILAAADGVIEYSGWQRKLGKMVTIDHGGGYKTQYGHMSKLTVEKGDRVKRGDKIGEIGNSGYSTGPHLHYEVLRDHRPQNPLNYIYDRTFYYDATPAVALGDISEPAS